MNSAEKKLNYSKTLDCACSVILNFPDKMVSSRWQATDSKLSIELHIIRYYSCEKLNDLLYVSSNTGQI